MLCVYHGNMTLSPNAQGCPAWHQTASWSSGSKEPLWVVKCHFSPKFAFDNRTKESKLIPMFPSFWRHQWNQIWLYSLLENILRVTSEFWYFLKQYWLLPIHHFSFRKLRWKRLRKTPLPGIYSYFRPPGSVERVRIRNDVFPEPASVIVLPPYMDCP